MWPYLVYQIGPFRATATVSTGGVPVDELQRRLVNSIRRMADARRIPLSHVPDRCGLGRAHFFEVLAGRASPTLAWVTKVASVFEVDPAQLLLPPTGQVPAPDSRPS